MTHTRFLLPALAALMAVPAAGSVIVIGSGPAEQCYQAARERSALVPSAAFDACNLALASGALDRRDTVATHVNRGILHMRRGDMAAGIADFDAALGHDPDQPEAYLNKGMALLNRDAAAEALPLFTVALDKRTRRPELAYYGRGVANETLGRVPEAYRDYVRASEIAPRWSEPRAELTRFRVME